MLKRIMRKTIVIYAIIGLVLGVGLFIYSLSNDDLTFYIGENKVEGVLSGIIAIPFAPLVMVVVGVIHAVIIFYPITFLYRKRNKK